MLNPQQLKFKDCYCNPKSPTFANALRSGLAAGYSQEYSESITAQGSEWFSEMLGDLEMLKDSEKALKEALNYEVRNEENKIDVGVATLKLKAAIFGAETIGRDKYSKLVRNDLTTGGEKMTGVVILPPTQND